MNDDDTPKDVVSNPDDDVDQQITAISDAYRARAEAKRSGKKLPSWHHKSRQAQKIGPAPKGFLGGMLPPFL